MRISFVGAGVMGETMLSSLLYRGIAAPDDIWACDISHERLIILKEKYRINCTSDNRQAVDGSDVIVLSVKPQSLGTVLRELKGRMATEQLVLSIVAGASISKIGKGLGHGAVVRAMPNTPAQVDAGISVWTATHVVTQAQKETARKILASLGKEIYVSDEKYIDMATAVSGSGPAYIFLVMEALIEAAVHIGLPREMAGELVLETVLGSAKMAQESGKHLAELKNMVTSPGGTTAEGLFYLEEGGLRAILAQAVIAAYEKAQLLGSEENK